MFIIKGNSSALCPSVSAGTHSAAEPLADVRVAIDLEEDLKKLNSKTCFYDMAWDDPLQYLSLVRLNKDIRADLIAVDQSKDKRAQSESIAHDLREGRWDSEQIQINFCDDLDQQKQSGAYIKDLLFYAYWQGNITRNEFHTGIHFMNLQEQFSEKEGDLKLSIVPIFNDNRELNDYANKFFINVVDNFKRRGFNDASQNTLLKSLNSCPKNLLFLTQIEFTQSDLTEYDQYIRDATVCNRMLQDQGYFSVGEGGYSKERSKDVTPFSAFFPSYGVLDSLLRNVTPNNTSDEIVKPIMYLGVMGVKKLSELHVNGYHPVAAVDVRVNNGIQCAEIHGYIPGPLFMEEHDTSFHVPFASRFSRSQIETLCKKIPNIVDQFIEIEKTLCEEKIDSLRLIVNRIIDLNRYPEDAVYYELIRLFNSLGTRDLQFKFFSFIKLHLNELLAEDHLQVQSFLDAIQEAAQY